MQASPAFPEMSAAYRRLFEYLPETSQPLGVIKPTALFGKGSTYGGLGTVTMNMSLYAVHGVTEEQLQRSQSQLPFKILPPTWCGNNQTLTREDIEEQSPLFPTWVAYSNTSFHTALMEVAEMLKSPTPPIHPPLVSILSRVSPSAQPVSLVNCSLLLAGTNPVTPEAELDLNHAVGSLHLAPNATLYMVRFTVSGIAAAALPGIQRNAASMQQSGGRLLNAIGSMELYDPGTSGLPLWAVDMKRDWYSDSTDSSSSNTELQLRLDSVVLVVSMSDYAALYSAAMRGPAWRTGARVSAPLFSRVAVFHATSTSLTALHLSLFEGWGWRGTNITFVPVQPLALYGDVEQLARILPDWKPARETGDAGDSNGGNTRRVSVGVGVGVGLGVPCLVLLVALLAMKLLHPKQSRAKELQQEGQGQQRSESQGRSMHKKGRTDGARSEDVILLFDSSAATNNTTTTTTDSPLLVSGRALSIHW